MAHQQQTQLTHMQSPQHRAATGVDSSQVTVNPKKRKDGEIDVTELTPCLGYYYLCIDCILSTIMCLKHSIYFSACCIITSCATKYPDCIGIDVEATVLCCRIEALLCKPSVEPEYCCICQRTEALCLWPTTCCKGITQCFCLDSRFAFPCDHDVPCVCTMLPFCVAFAFWKAQCNCMTKIKDLNNKA